MPTTYVDSSVLRSFHRYGVPREEAGLEGKNSAVIAVSLDDKISDLVGLCPQIRFFLHAQPRTRYQRLRDLPLTEREREHLLYQIIAAKRQRTFG